MNILVLDCAVTKLSIGVKTDSKFISTTYDIGMRQSEILVPAIDDILKKAEITTAELNFTALTVGPGSFTGLRLGISALKAIELAYNVPVYGISSLKLYEYPFTDSQFPIISCIDANKDKFYARISEAGTVLLEDGDYEISTIIDTVKNFEKIFICGPDALKLKERIGEENKDFELIAPKVQPITTESLVKITEEMIANGEPTLKDFDGPVYLRASEAEIALKNKE